MERLTIKAPSGLIHLKDNEENTINLAIKRLSDYEDLEDSGRLLELPCAVGDAVYSIYYNTEKGYYVDNPRKVTSVSSNIIWVGMFCYDYSDIGKSIFLTREAAEEALERMVNRNDKPV